MKYDIHISDLRAFLSCRRQWDWSSMLRQGLEPRITYAPFFTGRAIHYCLQKWYENGATPEQVLPKFVEHEVKNMEQSGALWPQELATVEEQVELIKGMVDHYFMWVAKDVGPWADKNLRFIAMETEFTVPIESPTGRSSTRIQFSGRFDGLVQRIDNGSYWLLETKTAKSIKGLQGTLDNDSQAGGYALAARKLFDKNVSGVLYNVLRKKLPTWPRQLVDGYLSQDKRIDTTPQVYIQAIKENHLEWQDGSGWTKEGNEALMRTYGDFLRYLMSEEYQSDKAFFARIPIRRTRQELDQLERDIHYIGLEMVRNPRIYPTASWSTCPSCRFKGPCLTMNAGGDFGSLLHSEYRLRREWDSVEDEGGFNGGSH